MNELDDLFLLTARPMRRRSHRILLGVLPTLALLGVLSICFANRQIVIDTSPSVAPGLYVRSEAAPAVGQLVEFCIPESVRSYIHSRTGLDGQDWYILKPVAAGPGDQVDTTQDELRINGRRIAPMPPLRDGFGNLLPRWEQNRMLGLDEFFVFSDRIPNSFDSRCYGPVKRGEIASVRRMLITWCVVANYDSQQESNGPEMSGQRRTVVGPVLPSSAPKRGKKMVSIKTLRHVTGTKRLSKPRYNVRLWCGAAAAGLMLEAGSAHAAFITSISPSDVPVFDTTSVFNFSQPGNVYTLEPGTSFIPAGFDVRDLFGGSFGTNGWEQNDVIFNNGQPAGTVNAVSVTLGAPTSLTSFNLYLEDDGTNGNRSASEFLLYAGSQLVDDVKILDTHGDQSYTGVYGSNFIDISDTLSGLPDTSDYTLELIQNQQGSGVRALEFEASSTPSAVPEPAAISAIGFGSVALCRRRKRA